jgi:cyanophycinase
MMAEGYERGLGFLGGIAIDQHFTQRNRFADMTRLVQTYPQLLGLGLDEGTAIIVQKSEARVLGKGTVNVFDSRRQVAEEEKPYFALHDGQRFDLMSRQVLAEKAGE